MSNQNHKKELENLQQTIIKLKHTIQQQPHTIHLTVFHLNQHKLISKRITIIRLSTL